MRPPWAGEDQLSLVPSYCHCYGRLGCGHDVPVAPGRLSPGEPDFDARILEVGGFDLDTVVAVSRQRLQLPIVVPAVDGTASSHGVLRPTVAVMLKDWPASPNALGRTDVPSEWLGIPRDTQILLVLFGSDRELERLWDRRSEFIRALDTFRPTAVVVPSFSTWDGDLWMEHRYQMMRSWHFIGLLQDHGHHAIPHLAWARRIDAADVADWLNANHSDLVSFDAQCLGDTFPLWLSQLVWVRERLVRPPTMLVAGIRSMRQLHHLFAAWPDTHVIYNGLRIAGAHRELRPGDGGTLHRVRYTPATDPERPSLWVREGHEDPEPGQLYQSSLRNMERVLQGFAQQTGGEGLDVTPKDLRLSRGRRQTPKTFVTSSP